GEADEGDDRDGQGVLRADQCAEADEMTVAGHVLDVLLDREGDADEPGQREPQPNELAEVAGGVAAGYGVGQSRPRATIGGLGLAEPPEADDRPPPEDWPRGDPHQRRG